jgi:sarcosine oxidase, subunit gamma
MHSAVDRPPRRPAAPAAAAPVEILDTGPAARFIFRGGERAVELAGSFGVALPRVPCRSASAGTRHALWLGPDEWLLLAAEDERDGIGGGLARALGDEPYSLVDIGHQHVGLIVRGAACGEVLNTGCPLDLDQIAFPVGMCTRTVFEKAEIVLWRTESFVFRIEVWRSFVPYVHALLTEAAREHAG